MSAGHIVIMSLIAMIYYFQNVIAGVAFPFLTFVLYLLEILVAFLQAYIFTMLLRFTSEWQMKNTTTKKLITNKNQRAKKRVKSQVESYHFELVTRISKLKT